MTSANVVEYRIEKDGKQVGSHYHNVMCNSNFEKLLVFLPLGSHMITSYGYDEEEEYWEEEPVCLESFLREMKISNKLIREYFVNEFYEKITNWLFPEGYTEVFSNHPLDRKREFHFSKEGVRVICVTENTDYCYMTSDIIKNPFDLSIKSGNFEIFTNKLDELHEYMKFNSDLIK